MSPTPLSLILSTSSWRLLYSVFLSVRRAGLGEGGRVLPAEEGLAASRHPCPRPAAGQAQHLLHLALATHQGSSRRVSNTV
jgi:hypothetical protein